jgi:hypothetical protein
MLQLMRDEIPLFDSVRSIELHFEVTSLILPVVVLNCSARGNSAAMPDK